MTTIPGRPTNGSVCTGYGGLDLAIEEVFGARTIWSSDIHPAANRIIQKRFPTAPNIGDITTVAWPDVRRPSIVSGGTPCQDVSQCGGGAGLRAGTRSGIWSSMALAIDILRPGLVVWENVRGVLSAGADSNVEPCPICMGEDERDSALRACGRVVGDLSELGYDAVWCGLRASAVGAPHPRYRVFVLAWPADAEGDQGGELDREPVGSVPNASSDGRDEGWTKPEGIVRGSDVALGSGTPLPDASRLGHERRGSARSGRPRPTDGALDAFPDTQGQRREFGRPGGGAEEISSAGFGGSEPLTDAGRVGRRPVIQGLRPGQPDPAGSGRTDWGEFTEAVRRWERILGRPAPPPMGRGAKGGPQISPRFTEWIMGLPEGWVTDVPDLTPNDQLHVLGNGVVPQQAVAALRYLLQFVPDFRHRANPAEFRDEPQPLTEGAI